MFRRIDSAEASLKLAQARLEDCRNQRLLFEQQMDLNSCADHRGLGLLLDEEAKCEKDVKLAELNFLEAHENRFRLGRIQIGKLWNLLLGVRSG